jgi:dTDP-4-amino-4,6-dideoxygalactose transaminase
MATGRPKYSPFHTVDLFEECVAEYAGAPFAVAVDTGTAAIFLALMYQKVVGIKVEIPRNTYVSVPAAIVQAGGLVAFRDEAWRGDYHIGNTHVIDSACRFRRGMYRTGEFRCLSFQYRKHLPIGRGGMVLTDDRDAVTYLKQMRFHGRHECDLADDDVELVGFPMYMEAERAARGLTLMQYVRDDNPDLEFDYPDLSRMTAFRTGTT